MIHRFGHAEARAVEHLLRLAREEDFGGKGDITSQAVIPNDLMAKATFVARSEGVLAGREIIYLVCNEMARQVKVNLIHPDGQMLKVNDTIASISGPLHNILAIERITLNFLQHLSGIASLTHRYMDLIKDTSCQILDTRKTLPGWRVLEKYAVRCGGGHNHRMGLYDAVMIKDNHLAGLRHHGTPLSEAVLQARANVGPQVIVEVEVETLDQLSEALTAEPDVVLLDNMKPDMLARAVEIRNREGPNVRLEASGGITLETLGAIARTGVDCVSIGALTHSAPALDIALDYQE